MAGTHSARAVAGLVGGVVFLGLGIGLPRLVFSIGSILKAVKALGLLPPREKSPTVAACPRLDVKAVGLAGRVALSGTPAQHAFEVVTTLVVLERPKSLLL